MPISEFGSVASAVAAVAGALQQPRGVLLARLCAIAAPHTAVAPAAARYHVDFVAKVLQPPDSTYLPPLAAFWYLQIEDSGTSVARHAYNLPIYLEIRINQASTHRMSSE